MFSHFHSYLWSVSTIRQFPPRSYRAFRSPIFYHIKGHSSHLTLSADHVFLLYFYGPRLIVHASRDPLNQLRLSLLHLASSFSMKLEDAVLYPFFMSLSITSIVRAQLSPLLTTYLWCDVIRY